MHAGLSDLNISLYAFLLSSGNFTAILFSATSAHFNCVQIQYVQCFCLILYRNDLQALESTKSVMPILSQQKAAYSRYTYFIRKSWHQNRMCMVCPTGSFIPNSE